ncbi:hypothetical protein ASPZODRAFT_126961 [Penicilliopsis zonata CBS 506.65]|uniref:SRP9 domain-containing protein n=1 Tax=Penicilliopsis zonata CBS 506.65 TaxID=1073090 RepID=A0A1L9SV41_9EURO|nr:hypothetical protein ASPZODRAFT_126961 [Penicilliopsis zonata CBS 506.65]OJJ50981.1 hypothetical protein ASPZODRAFT_126961 [Penicilliopsis zonata CBS 506.65]
MPYLPTSQAFLEQSCLLLEAYPETTRITAKYNFPSTQTRSSRKPTSPTTTNGASNAPAAPVASLTLKTYDPRSGVCLKYRTNKVAEVGRLFTSFGKLAAGADVASLGLTGAAAPTAATADVEMGDAPALEESAGAAAGATGGSQQGATTGAGTTPAKAGGGKSKKKGGKGKR